MSTALQSFQQSLKACQDSLDKWNAQKISNDIVTKYNDNQNKAYAAALIAWKTDKTNKDTEYTTKSTEWNTKVNQRYSDWKGVRRRWNNCVVWNETSAGKHNDWCQNDNGMAWHVGQEGGCTWGWGFGTCAYSDEQARNNALVDAGQQPQPPNIPQQPSPDQYPKKEQNLTPFNLNCCSNLTTVVGSSIENSTIDQSNKCIQELQQKINYEQNKPTSAPQAPQSNTPSQNLQDTTSGNVDDTTTPVQKNNNKLSTTTIMFIIAILICISFCSFLLTGGFILIATL